MIYLKYLRVVVKSMLQYRLNLLLMAIGQIFNASFMFAGIALLFARFGKLDDWTFGEVALCYAVMMAAWSLTECFARGFDTFRNQIVTGDFDRILLRPRNPMLQVLGSAFEFPRLVKLLWSFTVLVIAVSQIGIEWNAARVLTLAFMVVSGTFIFSGIFILGATVCFWTVEGLEIINIFTDGGRELAAYPLTIYSKWMRRFFTFILPFGCFNYLPLMYITGRAAERWAVLYMLTPLAGIAFIIPCVLIFNFGIKHYLSTGS